MIESRLQRHLDSLRSQAQFRTLEQPSGINFCSNDYLALASDPRLRQAVSAAIAEGHGVGGTGSRLLSGHSKLWDELEEEFAEFEGAQAALFFGSGYAANVGLLASVLQPEDTVFSDQLNHASLVDGIRMTRAERVIFPHLDLTFLEDALSRNSKGEKFIVVESIFSMDGDRAPVRDLISLCERFGANLIVDEAHATGVAGPEGRGLVAEAGRSKVIFATVHTCGKALASVGAFVAGSQTLKDYLINRARTFIFSTALPPYIALQVRAALRLARAAADRRSHLEEIGELLRTRLKQSGFDTRSSESQIVPVVLGSNEAALQCAERLNAAGFGVRAIRPPTVPQGTARLRISLTSGHSKDDVEKLVVSLGEGDSRG
jgi:8-amino-7-oxononanoate synthase